MTNSIFDFAPHELNHSAFWAWILASLSKDNHKNKENEIRWGIATRFLKEAKLDKAVIKNISVEHQASPKKRKSNEGSKYDIKAVIKRKNGKSTLLVIETKVKARAVLDQLEKYIKTIERECKKEKMKGYLILLDIQGKSPLLKENEKYLTNKAKNRGIGFKILTPADVIAIIKSNKSKTAKKYDGYLVNDYLEWIEGNKSFWEYICKRVVYKISEKRDKKRDISKPKKHKGWGWKLEYKKIGIGEVGLIFEENSKEIRVECWFGEKSNQIKEIFNETEKIRKNLKKLANKGWEIKPELYFCTHRNKRHFAKQIKSEKWEKYFDVVYNHKDEKNILYSANEIEKKFREFKKLGAIKGVDSDKNPPRKNDTHCKLSLDIKKIKNHKVTLKRSIGALYKYKTRDLLENPGELKKIDRKVYNKINEALNDLPSRES